MSSTVSNAVGSFAFESLAPRDLPFLIEIRNECREFLHDNREFTLADAERWFEAARPTFWLIRYEGNPIGYFRTSDYSTRNRTMMAGADLHRDYRGKGLGYASWKAFLDFAFPYFNLYSVSLEVLASNERALSLYQKLGFQIEGHKRGAILRDGNRIDSILMSLLASEWQ